MKYLENRRLPGQENWNFKHPTIKLFQEKLGITSRLAAFETIFNRIGLKSQKYKLLHYGDHTLYEPPTQEHFEEARKLLRPFLDGHWYGAELKRVLKQHGLRVDITYRDKPHLLAVGVKISKVPGHPYIFYSPITESQIEALRLRMKQFAPVLKYP